MQVKYAGKKFEILSTSDVRYQGVMYSADPSEQSITFKNVFCYGTEDRRTGDQKVEKSTCTYEYIVFRAVSLRELWLLEGNGRRLDVADEILILLPLTSEMLQDAKPAKRDQLIGERLFPKIQVALAPRREHVLLPRLAGKITGMLLEMDNTELLVLLSEQRALMNKINQALGVLKLAGYQQKQKQSQQKQSQQNPGSTRTRAAAIQRATPKQNDERPSNAMIDEYESKEFDDVSKVKAAPAKKDKKAAKKANSKADDSDEEGSSFDDSSHSDDEKEDVSKVNAAPAKKDKKPKEKPFQKALSKEAEKKRLIGRYLFALTKIQDVEPRLAGKTGRTIVTGMLLEMDNTELLVLLSEQRALMNKINEALAVLKDHQQKQLRLHLEKHESKEAESKVKAAPAKKDKKAGWNPIQKMTAALRRRDAANALGEFMRSEDE